jgi:hypothetical protein
MYLHNYTYDKKRIFTKSRNYGRSFQGGPRKLPQENGVHACYAVSSVISDILQERGDAQEQFAEYREKGYTILQEACRIGHLKIIISLIKQIPPLKVLSVFNEIMNNIGPA